MSRESDYLARLKSNADKEVKTAAVSVTGTPTKFTSQLTEDYFRKQISAYNNTHADSGEVVWGPSTLTAANGLIIPKGVIVDIPVSTDIDVYFCNTISGEASDLRIVEMA